MMYLVALVVPPLAILLCGKFFQAVLALILQITVIGWLPAALWAMFVVNGAQQERRNKRLLDEMRKLQGR